MDLALTDEQQWISDSAADFLADASTMARVRAASDSADGFDAALWRGLADLGWCGVHLPQQQGGLGLGLVELVLLQEQLGRRLACAPFFESVALAATCLRELPAGAGHVPRLARGDTVATLAWPMPTTALPLARSTGSGWVLNGVWPQVGAGALAGLLLLPAQAAGGELLLFAVEAGTPQLQRHALATLDATRRAAAVHADGMQLPKSACIGVGQGLDLALERTRCLAAIALAAEQVGVAEQCLSMTLAFTAQRQQFGRPIAGFQAVKHRCAQMAVLLEGARSAVYGAACAADAAPDAAPDADSLLFCAAQALCEAGEAAQFCSQEAIQLHGGVGFTWAYDPHLYFRRAQAASQRLGPFSAWREQVAAQLLDRAAA
jgi:alkylation response protein AidB-like acyl-CoA dehydrogenase